MTAAQSSTTAKNVALAPSTAAQKGSPPKDMETVAQFGDMMHMLTLCSTFGFAYMAALHFDMFDETWKKEGFCVTNRDVDFWSSHDVCFYVDTAAALILGCVYLLYSPSQSAQVNKEFLLNIPGIFGHGLAHAAIGMGIRTGLVDSSEAWKSFYQTMSTKGFLTSESIQGAVANLVFWLFLLKAILPKLSHVLVVALSMLIMSVQVFVPQVFGFTFVQTVLLVLYSWAQMQRPVEEKGYSYALYSALVGFPLVMVSILESTLCSTFVKDWLYGHVVYDAYIPASILVWYLLCYKEHKSTKEKEA
jgi:hypothetical protein